MKTTPLILATTLLAPFAQAVVIDGFEVSPVFADGNPAGPWVRGPAAYHESYGAGGGILDRSATDLGTRAISLNPDPANSWLYRDTGTPFAPNTTYTLKLHAGSRQNSAYQQGGDIEFGLWSGVPASPATQPPLSPDQAGGHLADTSLFPPQTMVQVASYSFTTGSDVSGLGNIVVFVRNLESGSGRSSIDEVILEADGTLPDRPNILWIVAEDMSPTLGCYGDQQAITPRIDALAAQGLRYNMCWSNAPICSVARTTLISGVHATRTGGFSHRSAETLLAPGFMRFYPRLLQEAGYYTSNNSKEDYNVVPAPAEDWRKGWNDSSNAAHWRNAPAGQPFFSIFNMDSTHESRIRPVGGTYPVTKVHDPADIRLPDCHPDLPSLREAWASHHDYITDMDADVGAILDQLTADGLDDDTIVFFYSDHGSCVPGYKRFVGNRGQRAPLVIRFPAKYAHLAPPGYTAGGDTDELVSFVDFAPTLLSLLDCEIPAWMMGRAFAGPRRAAAPDHLVGYVCRHDTRIANARSITDGRYVCIRNYQLDTPHGNWSRYTNGDTGTTPDYATLGAGEWLLAWLNGGLSPHHAHFFENQGGEQLYDLATDPDETINLAHDPSHAAVLNQLRTHLEDWQSEHRDGGLITEGRLYDLVNSTGLTPWEVIGDDSLFPYADVLDTARRASSEDAADVATLASRLSHADATVRLWAARGLHYHGRAAVRAHQAALVAATSDSDYWVRVSAHQALAIHATEPARASSVDALFAFCNRWGIAPGGVVDRDAERKIHFAGNALSQLPYLDASYRAHTALMNNETYTTTAYRRQLYYWFYAEFNHPLAHFRWVHGLDKTGADDLANPSGDGISNLLRYACKLSPDDGDLLKAASPQVMEPGGNAGLPALFRDPADQQLKYQFVRRTSTSGPRITYETQHSGDLQSWSPLGNTESIEPINADWERVTITLDQPSPGYLRMAIQR